MKASSSEPVVSQSVLRVRASAFLRRPFSLAKSYSIGLRSGELEFAIARKTNCGKADLDDRTGG
jgi:hypothetical protein